MKKFFKLGGAIAGVALLANSANAVLLSSLIANDGSLTIGDKTFADFSFGLNSGAGGAGQTAGAGDIDVTVGIDSFGDYFLQLQGMISSGVGGQVDLSLQYSVTASGGNVIVGIDQAFNLGAAGNGGTLIISESANANAFPPVGNQVAHSIVSFSLGTSDPSDPAGEIADGDQLTVPNLSQLFMATDIRLLAADRSSMVAASIIHQSFHQANSVPDGGSTLLLLGSALGCLSFISLRRKC